RPTNVIHDVCFYAVDAPNFISGLLVFVELLGCKPVLGQCVQCPVVSYAIRNSSELVRSDNLGFRGRAPIEGTYIRVTVKTTRQGSAVRHCRSPALLARLHLTRSGRTCEARSGRLRLRTIMDRGATLVLHVGRGALQESEFCDVLQRLDAIHASGF